MTVETKKETLGFQAEVKQLLHLVTHSLYSNKEIFLRELISNASDAADKLRFEALNNDSLLEKDPKLRIRVSFDKKARTITIRDNGIGMNRQEVIDNLGTIAKSGTREFISKLSGDKAKDSNLIGQFGVGFYSAFIVAGKVRVETRRAGESVAKGVRWVSDGSGEYSLENIERKPRGTKIVLHLKKGEDQFLDDFELKRIINKYSDHISIPVEMKAPEEPEVKDDKTEDASSETKEKPEYETINKATALWTRAKNEIKEEEYKEFYKHVSHDFEDPLYWTHNRVEGKTEYTTLLYFPAKAPFDLWQREGQRGLKLFIKRVFIMDDVEQFLPMYLRFIKGVVDADDLPLNISREILQGDKKIDSMRAAITKRVLTILEKLAKNDKETYQKFWDEFGQVLKEGPAEDFTNREKIANLLRFSTTHTDNVKQDVSLADYVSRMKEGQDKIYYVTAESFTAAKNSPHLEIFRKKGIEVILLSDRVDEWLVGNLFEFDKKQLQSVAKGDLDLGKLDSEDDKKEQEKIEKDFETMVKQVKEVLKDRVKEVRITHRLTDSPACVVADDQDMNMQMQRILKMAGQEAPVSKPILELNPEHVIIEKLRDEADTDRFAEWSNLLLDQSILAEGGQLDDPARFVKRVNGLLVQ